MEGTDPALIEAVDAVVNLAGETIEGRWTSREKVISKAVCKRYLVTVSNISTPLDTPPKFLFHLPFPDFMETEEKKFLLSLPRQETDFSLMFVKTGSSECVWRLVLKLREQVDFDPTIGAPQKLSFLSVCSLADH